MIENREKISLIEKIDSEKRGEYKLMGKKVANEIRNLRNRYKKEKDFFRAYSQLQRRLIRENPQYTLLLEILFGVKDLAEIDKKLAPFREKKEASPEFSREELLTMTEWQFMATHFLAEQSEDKEFAARLWSSYELIFQTFSKEKPVKYKRGIIGQVGVYKMLRHFGFKPKIAHPEEDAFKKTDIWCYFPEKKGALPIQVKYTKKVKKPLICSSQEIGYPSVVIDRAEKNEEVHLSSDAIEEMPHLKESCQSKALDQGKRIYSFVIPRGSFDALTGQPKKEFLKQIEPEIKKYFESR